MIYDQDLADELEWNIFNVDLLSYLNYKTNYTLNGVNLILTFDYNNRNNLYSLLIEDSYGNVLLPTTFIKYGRRCELNQIAQLSGLDYYVTLRPKDSSKTFDDYDYINWKDDFWLCFCGRDYSLTTRMKNNITLYFTQNY